MLCHCMFSCNKHTTLAGDADDGQAVHVCGQGMYENSLYLPLNFAMNLKLLLKKQKGQL